MHIQRISKLVCFNITLLELLELAQSHGNFSMTVAFATQLSIHLSSMSVTQWQW